MILGFQTLDPLAVISTPNLDSLAKDGKILTNYHTRPVCSPARVSFLTGIDNHIGGIGTMYENMAHNQVGKQTNRNQAFIEKKKCYLHT
jgi:arylsulfatase A-like enzyme